MKKICLLLGFLILLIGCEKEALIEEKAEEIIQEDQVRDVISKELPFEKTRHYENIKSRVSALSRTLSKNSQKKAGDTVEVRILTNEVLYNSYAGTHTYTFKVLRERTEYLLENIVLHYNTERDAYDEYLVQYDVNWKEYLQLYEGKQWEDSEKVKVTKLRDGYLYENLKTCYSVATSYTDPCRNGHTDPNKCEYTGDEAPQTYIRWSSFCISPENESLDEEATPGTGGGGGGTTPTDDDVVTKPGLVAPCSNDGGSGGSEYSLSDGDGNCLSLDGDDDLPEPEEEEDKIYTDELNNDCVEAIISRLQQKDSHLSVIPDLGIEVSHLSQIVLDLFEGSQDYNLNFKIDDATNANGESRNAFTTGKWNRIENVYELTITLDENYISNATQLAIARTIIHESVHGYLRYNYQEYPFATFSELLRTYFDEMSDDEAHHLLMTQYAEAMGASLAAWDNHALANENYYTAMAWTGGMIKTEAYNRLDENFKDIIKEALENEGSAIAEATEDAKGTSNCQ